MIKNFYTAHEAKPGDIFVVTVKVMVQYDGRYKIYRCPWPDAQIGEDGSPQGDDLYASQDDLQTTAETLMPVLLTSEGVSLF